MSADSNVGRNGPSKVPMMQLTDEEANILKEYKTKSYWNYCVPLTAGSVFAVYQLARTGRLKAHPKIGFAGKYISAVWFGYLGGKLLAFPKYRARLLELQEGHLVNELRGNRSGHDVAKHSEEPVYSERDSSQDVGPDSFAERRRRSRAQFGETPPLLPTPTIPASQSSYPDQPPLKSRKTNQYGDLIEE